MNVLWIFLAIVVFCIYVLFGLHVTEGLETAVQKVLGWTIYTILWIVFLNVFILGYFWSVIRKKTGPYGVRGQEGETGQIGLKGECSITASQAYCMQQQTHYINDLYKAKTNQSILNEDTQKFPCTYLNEKIQKIAGSRQYQLIVATLSNDNKGINNIVNYLKSIWAQWFELLYNGTSNPGVWFTDEFGDENYEWSGGRNPFDEIKKYDVYYWGITRDFRPLKAEICRAPMNNVDSKFPRPQYSTEQLDKQVSRLRIVQTNSYYKTGDTRNSDHNNDGSWWSPNVQTIDGEEYYPVGDVMAFDYNNPTKKGQTIVGEQSFPSSGKDGPDIKTILVAGDVVDPVGYVFSAYPYSYYNTVRIRSPICPDGYTSLGDVSTSVMVEGKFNKYKCVPSDCVEEIAPGPKHESHDEEDPLQWDRYNRWFKWNKVFPGHVRTWYSNINALNREPQEGSVTSIMEKMAAAMQGKPIVDNLSPSSKNGYNLMRGGEFDYGPNGLPWYRIKKSCLQKVPNRPFAPLPDLPLPQAIRDVEPNHDELGIGWYGHPYKLDPKYSIFSFLNLVPEGMIVNQGTGQRFYIIHVEGDEVNMFNILTYNNNTNKFDGSLQVNINNIPDPNDKLIPNNSTYKDNSPGQVNPKVMGLVDQSEVIPDSINYNAPNIPRRIIITKLDRLNKAQQWRIILNQDKKLFKIQNLYNYTYLIATQEPLEGLIEFTTIDIYNYRNDPPFASLPQDEMDNRTNFTFIPSFGTHMDIVEKAT